MIAIKYAVFAAIATLFNLTFQFFSFTIYDDLYSLYIAMLIGTLAGLVCKYILDKKYIFYHIPKNKKDDAKKFILYSFMGVFTTVIFWTTEIIFDTFSQHHAAKYIGAAIGLGIGYVLKYSLDKKYVFIEK